MTRISSGPSSARSIGTVATSATKRGKFLSAGMKTVGDALKDLSDAPTPTPNIFEWVEEWEEMARDADDWEEQPDPEEKSVLATKTDAKALRATINVYLFSRLNQPTDIVLKPLQTALNTTDARAAITNLENMIS